MSRSSFLKADANGWCPMRVEVVKPARPSSSSLRRNRLVRACEGVVRLYNTTEVGGGDDEA